MAFSLDIADKFGKTFLDFWRLGSRAFLAEVKRDPSSYFSPYQFFVVSVSLCLSMLLIELGLIDGLLKEITNHKPESDASARAGRIIVLVVFVAFMGSLFVTLASRAWPIRRRPTLRTIVEFMCYVQAALLVPMAALEVLVAPFLSELVLREVIPTWSMWIPVVAGFLIGNIVFFVYVLPGLSELLNASKSRIFWGLAFWSFVLTFIPSFIFGFWMGIKQAGG